jgi:hypothetical protein
MPEVTAMQHNAGPTTCRETDDLLAANPTSCFSFMSRVPLVARSACADQCCSDVPPWRCYEKGCDATLES